MKVARIRWRPYRVPFRSPYVTSRGTATHREGLLLELTSDSGLVGLGEASLLPDADNALQRLGSLAERMTPLLLDVDVSDELDFEAKGEAGQAMASAVDCAMLDLVARSRGISVAKLLAGDVSVAPEVQVNALLSQPDIADLSRAAAAARDAGFTTVKLKVGMATDVRGERERVAAVREAVGPGVRIRLDANGAWSFEGAMEMLPPLCDFDIEYIEQPIPPGDFIGLRALQEVGIRIAADEEITDAGAAQVLIGAKAVNVLVLKPAQLGGLRATQAIARQAREAGLDVVITTSIETGIGTAACLQLAALLPDKAHGLATLGLLEHGLILDPGLPIERGVMRLPDAPGLGVELDPEALDRYALGDWLEA